MHAGATLSRRFTLLRLEAYDVPGVQRWIAHDERRAVDVHVDIISSPASGAVRQEAVRAVQVRDLRFTRILATGREQLKGEQVTYVVTEPPAAVPLTALVGQRVVPPHVAAAIIGGAAHALEHALGVDLHHGLLRPQALHVANSGRVVISGLGTEGQLAIQAGISDGRSERADARALARLHLALITGVPADDATVESLPEYLSPRAAELARDALVGKTPSSLAEVARALSPADARLLRNVSHTLTDWPWAPGAEPPPAPRVVVPGVGVALQAATLERAELFASLALVSVHARAELTRTIQVGRVATVVEDVTDDAVPTSDGPIPVSAEQAAKFSARIRRAVARQSHKELGLDTWDVIATEQNHTPPPSVVQAVLEWLQRRWPRSVPIGTAAEQARHRAHRPAPLKTGPVLVSVFLAITIVAGIVAFEILTSPLNPDGDIDVEPPSHYPEFTFSPEPEPSPDSEDAAKSDAEGDE